MKKELLFENIENLTSKEKGILNALFKNKEDVDLTELIKNIKKSLKEVEDKEAYNKLMNKLTEFNKELNQEVERWWRQAKRDLESANNSLNSGDFYIASFLSQQVIEKGLKALYLNKKNYVKKIHNIVILAKELNLPTNLIEDCDEVNPVYTDTRYPDVGDSLPSERYTEERSKEDINIAKRILKWLEKKI